MAVSQVLDSRSCTPGLAFPVKAVPGAVDRGIIVALVMLSIPTIAACNMLAMVLIARFRLDKGQHEANLAELRRREAVRAS